MSSVLDRDALERSPLADLHLLANELGVDGFRRLRKAELIDASSPASPAPSERRAEAEPEPASAAARAPRRTPSPTPRPRPSRGRGRRRGRGRGRRPTRTRRPAGAAARRGGRGRGRRDDEAPRPRRPHTGAAAEAPSRGGRATRVAEGVVELLGNGSAFIRLDPPETTDDDVYVSAAQVKRCELVSGDRVAGPGARAAPLGALPVARARRHDQRPAGRGGRRGHALRRPAGGVAVRAARAGLRGRDAQGRRVADAVRQGLARAHLRRPARRQVGAGARDRRGARGPRGPRAARRPRRRAAGGGGRLERARARRGRLLRRVAPTRRRRRSSRRSSRGAASRRAAATPWWWSTRSSGSPP